MLQLLDCLSERVYSNDELVKTLKLRLLPINLLLEVLNLPLHGGDG